MQILITFMSGAGNIFTVIDNRQYKFDIDMLSKIAPNLCKKDYNLYRNTEGLIAVDKNFKEFDFDVLFFNPDGSHSMMCGNGARCAIKFAQAKKIIKNEIHTLHFKMQDEIYHADIVNNLIKIKLPPPREIKNNIYIQTKIGKILGTYVNVNSDHFVINCDELIPLGYLSIENLPVDYIGKEIRFNPLFPNGTNADFYKIINNSTIQLRTYERGVEAETGACGTGALATAITALINHQIVLPVKIIPTSSIPLFVEIKGNLPDNINGIELIGPAEIIAEKEIELEIY